MIYLNLNWNDLIRHLYVLQSRNISRVDYPKFVKIAI